MAKWIDARKLSSLISSMKSHAFHMNINSRLGPISDKKTDYVQLYLFYLRRHEEACASCAGVNCERLAQKKKKKKIRKINKYSVCHIRR